MNYFNSKSSLFEITEKYPETIDVFTSNGFSHMADPDKRSKLGRTISLETALILKNLDYDSFANLLHKAIVLKDKQSNSSAENEVKVVGLLPCPVRIPLLEGFNDFVKTYEVENNVGIKHELKAASMGLDWVENNIKGIENPEDLPDLFISAGFDMFFDEKLIGGLKNQGVFEDSVKFKKFNESFSKIELKDPKSHYSIISVVPAVFLINTKELGDLPMPRTWEDILDPVFENRVSLPVGDFDLFNGILLNIHKKYGDEGVRSLGRNLLESLHPSQMVKSGQQANNRPIITIMPNFFTKMAKPGGTMVAVWPEDGAIISPIFMLSKKQKKEQLQPIIDYFASVKVAEILSHNGLFPSTNPDIDNRLEADNKFIWLGWDYIYSNDISQLISHCEAVFNESIRQEAAV